MVDDRSDNNSTASPFSFALSFPALSPQPSALIPHPSAGAPRSACAKAAYALQVAQSLSDRTRAPPLLSFAPLPGGGGGGKECERQGLLLRLRLRRRHAHTHTHTLARSHIRYARYALQGFSGLSLAPVWVRTQGLSDIRSDVSVCCCRVVVLVPVCAHKRRRGGCRSGCTC
jgi:hypothetical protein